MPAKTTTSVEPKDEESTTVKPPLAARRHSKFYFDNTLIVIQIEDTLFNVHKYQLIKSVTFSDMFSVPKAETDEPEEGSSPEHPIVMEGVSASDFEALLTVLYATHFSTHQPAPEASLIIPSFRLANMWNFSDLRAYLLPLAEKVLGDVDKISFAREFDIKDWLTPCHVRLCERTEPLTTEEATKLGIHSLLMISRMREQPQGQGTRKTSFNPGTYYCNNCVGVANYYGGTITCPGCSAYTSNTFMPSQPANGTVTLETQVKQWVEDGCILK